MTISSLRYVGRPSSVGTDIVTKFQINDLLTGIISPNRTSASGDAQAAASVYATQVYVNNQDALYELPSYYQERDNLNVPVSSVGAPNGVANLDADGKIPSTQIPAMGSAFMQGPFGPTATFNGSASNTPFKIADWNIGVRYLVFQPLIFGVFLVTCNAGGRPVVEIKMSNGSAPYASQTRIGIGMGRAGFNAYQPITVLPAAASTGQSGNSPGWAADTNIWASAWLYDQNSQTSTVTSGSVASAAIFLARLAQ